MAAFGRGLHSDGNEETDEDREDYEEATTSTLHFEIVNERRPVRQWRMLSGRSKNLKNPRSSRGAHLPPHDIKAIRVGLDKSQAEFARMIGVSVSTLQNWEQGRRQPEGAARALLRVTAENPDAVARALRLSGPSS